MPTIDPANLSKKEAYFLVTSLYVPRPIAFIGTQDSSGNHNLAPFSYTMGVSSKPPLLMVSVGDKRGGEPKDTLRNIQTSGDYTINIVTEEILHQMHRSAEALPPELSEFEHVGLTPQESSIVTAPGVLESPITLEMQSREITRIDDAGCTLILGEVKLFHIDDAIYHDGRVDNSLLPAVGRLGYNRYAIVKDVIDMAGRS